MKVNHAGEHGAVSIYTGQILIAKFTNKRLADELALFKAHEQIHRAIFAGELERRGLSRCRSYWLCAAGGFSLGILTGLLGQQAIAATTVAVERVVLRHLGEQLDTLGDADARASAAISAILAEEQEHHDGSFARIRPENIFTRMLGALVSSATESVIWIGMRV
ncbi:MAG: demethoxyubiquinone hydroxylase family protein [Massilia sp.]